LIRLALDLLSAGHLAIPEDPLQATDKTNYYRYPTSSNAE